MKKYILILFLLLGLKYIYSQNLFGYPIIPAPSSFFNLTYINLNINSSNINSAISSYFASALITALLGVYNIEYVLSDNQVSTPISLNQAEYLYFYYNFPLPVEFCIVNSSNPPALPTNVSCLYNYTSTSLFNYIYLNPGNYSLIIYNGNSIPIYGFFYYYTEDTSNYPMFLPYGISDFGIALFNDSDVYFYSYNTTEFIGEVNVNNLQLSNLYCNTNGLTFQLNTILLVNTTNESQYYFLQNVLELNLSSNTYFFADNIWNFTYPSYSLTQGSIQGNGKISQYNNTYFYGYVDNQIYNLNYPLTVYLVTNITENNNYPEVQFGYSLDGENIIWYDNVTIEVPSNSYYMVVSPVLIFLGGFGEASLIIGGPGFGTCSYINNANLNLSLYFLYNYNNIQAISPIEYFFNYGLLTEETSSNIFPEQYEYYLTYYSGQPILSFFSYTTTSQNYYNVTIIYPNGTEISNIYPANYELNITFPQYINISNYSIENLSSIIINGQPYYNNPIEISVNNNLTIVPNYTLEYLLQINSPYAYILNGNIYYGNNSFWIPYGDQINLEFRKIIYISNYTRYFLYDVYVNNLLYNSSNLTININNYTEVYANYVLQYLVNISSPFQFSLNNENYYNFTNWVNNGTEINIEWNSINNINQDERYYCNINNQDINITGPINIDISNYCNLQYLVTIYTNLPVNISINGEIYDINGTYSNYFNKGTIINIEPIKYKFSSFFTYTIYYYSGNNYYVDSPQYIDIIFDKKSGYNYLNIGILSSVIAGVVIFILW
ncbi:thermopsin [Nanoarchaeota archaeon]